MAIMRERGPTLVAIGLLMVLVTGTWWAADYARKAIPIDPPARITHEPDAWARQFVMIQTNPQGEAVHRVEGVAMRHYPDDDSYEVDNITATGQQANAPLTIGTAKLATMDADTRRIILSGNANLRRQASDNHPELNVSSAQLTLYPNDDVIETQLPARIVNGSHVLNGTGMRYNNKTRQLEVFSSTDVTISGQDSSPQSRPK